MNINCAFPAAMANGAGPIYSASQMRNAWHNYHHATIQPKSRFKRFRTHKNKFGTGVDVVWGIKPKSKAGPRGGVVYVHAINFDANRFTPRQAKKWLKDHGYKPTSFVEAKKPLKLPKPTKRPAKRAANILPTGVAYQYVANIAANPTEPVVGPKSINEAIKLVRNHATNAYARAYADAAMRASTEHGMQGLEVQVLYILNNLRGWRGPLAKETKKFMKGWVQAQQDLKGKKSRKNPTLMILSNPMPSEREVNLAKKAYKSFHFNESKRQTKQKVPDGWPQVYVVLGTCDAFTVNSKGKTIKRTFNGTKPSLCCTKDRSDVFIFSKNGKLRIPSGTAVRVDYTVPPHSGRKKWSRAWYHPHESKPKVHAHKSGKAVRISGPKLSVTPRGIIG